MVTKIVITLKADSATVGIERTDCDPVFFRTAFHELQAVLTTLPGFMEQANQKWQTAPKNPSTKFQPPPPPPPASSLTRPATTVTPARPSTTIKPAPKLQDSMF